MHPAVAVLFYLCYTFAISCYSHHALLFAAGGNCRAAAEATGGFKMDQINETGTNNTDKSKNMDKIHESGKKYTFEDLREIMRTLRSENGCPWDRRQTHERAAFLQDGKSYFAQKTYTVHTNGKQY